MPIADPFVDELTMEAATTKRVLERVPEAHLAWQPHPKSMSLGQLALHVATLPSVVAQFLSGDALDFDSAGDHMADLTTALAASKEAIEHLVSSGERTGPVWTIASAPGKWSPSQIVEHMARSLEESANMAAGRPSKSPDCLRWPARSSVACSSSEC
jgi:hypothetical protein